MRLRQVTREKIVRFFAEGSKRLRWNTCEKMVDRNPYKWTSLDHELFNSATTCAAKSMRALLGSKEDSKCKIVHSYGILFNNLKFVISIILIEDVMFGFDIQ